MYLSVSPVVGDQVEWNNTIWTVAVMEGNKIAKVGVRFPEDRKSTRLNSSHVF